MSEATRTVHVLISGRVQGVWFRGWTEQEARSLGLDGWVRNRRDGIVEAVFSGPADKVQRMLDACADGPPAARVGDVEILGEGAPVAPGFAVKSTV